MTKKGVTTTLVIMLLSAPQFVRSEVPLVSFQALKGLSTNATLHSMSDKDLSAIKGQMGPPGFLNSVAEAKFLLGPRASGSMPSICWQPTCGRCLAVR